LACRPGLGGLVTRASPLHGGHPPMRLIDLGNVLVAREQEERERREKAGRPQNLLDCDYDDELPIPEGPAPQVSGEMDHRYGNPGSQVSGRTVT
jgi:hypothetical protein